MAERIEDVGRFSESGRGVPVALSRPSPALPFSPLVRQAYAPMPRARLGWGQGVILVRDVALEPVAALDPDAPLCQAAQMMLDDESGFVPVCTDGRLVGVIYLENVLQCVADDRTPPNVGAVMSTQIPTCTQQSVLVDAVRQMIRCYLRKIPVVGDAGELLGLLTLCEASAAAARDPAVGDVLERFAVSASALARRMR
jgi:CBS domain-containing protein